MHPSRSSGKGEVTIPVEIRERLSLEPGDTPIEDLAQAGLPSSCAARAGCAKATAPASRESWGRAC
jgi:hypothetical protein